MQGVGLRGNLATLSPALQQTVISVRDISLFLSTDRALEQELRACLTLIRQQHWQLYD